MTVGATGAGRGSDEILALRAVVKRFGSLRAVDGVDLNVKQGEFFSLLGPPGCGKTTLLRMISGFDHPQEGDILLGGNSVLRIAPHRRRVNTIFATLALFPHMTVAENVAYGLRQRHLQKSEIAKQVAETLSLVRMEESAKRRPRQLSGVEQQRVALARAIANKPDVVLLDEPMSALGRRAREQMRVELMVLQRRVRITFVYATDDQGEAMSMSDRIAVMNGGRIEQVGTPREVYENPRSAFVAQFVGDQNFFDAVIHADGRVDGEDTVFETEPGVVNGYYAGTRLSLVVRAEAMKVSSLEPMATTNRVEGRLVGTSFLGNDVQHVVVTDAGHEIISRTPVGSAERLEPGASVWCHWPADSIRVFSREA